MSHSKVITLDVRDDLRQGREPFSRIMQTVATLKPDQDLLLVAPFQPTPLFAVLAQQGFSHEAKATPAGDWEVRFTRSPMSAQAQPPSQAAGNSAHTGPQPGVIDVDARGLEPPEPLVKIMQAVQDLPLGMHLRARTDRNPLHLHPRLAERGFIGETDQQPDGSFVTCIRPLTNKA